MVRLVISDAIVVIMTSSYYFRVINFNSTYIQWHMAVVKATKPQKMTDCHACDYLNITYYMYAAGRNSIKRR